MPISDTEINLLGMTLFLPGYAKLAMFAAIFGAIIGIEREWKQKVASVRTFAIISAGSCFFASLSTAAAGGSVPNMPYDVTRVAAGIVTGIGFLGGGVIFKTRDGIEGITTGAMIWFTAAIGMACGFNQVAFATWGMVVYTAIMLLSKPIYGSINFLRTKMWGEEEEDQTA